MDAVNLFAVQRIFVFAVELSCTSLHEGGLPSFSRKSKTKNSRSSRYLKRRILCFLSVEMPRLDYLLPDATVSFEITGLIALGLRRSAKSIDCFYSGCNLTETVIKTYDCLLRPTVIGKKFKN